jgi:hypothetical protein
VELHISLNVEDGKFFGCDCQVGMYGLPVAMELESVLISSIQGKLCTNLFIGDVRELREKERKLDIWLVVRLGVVREL